MPDADLPTAMPPERARLLDAVANILPDLSEHAAEAEALRRLPDASVEALMSTGIHRAYVPTRHGGMELDFALQVDLGDLLGGACGAAAWCGLFFTQHPLVVGMMPPEAQDDVWGNGPDLLIANAFFTPGGTCTPVDGGFVLDGDWIISSGVDHCAWNNLNVMVPQPDGPPEHRFMLVPRADYTIRDDWRSSGLAGTGSNGISLDKVFVPEHRTIATAACLGGPTPGSAANNGYLYRLPLMATFPVGPAAIAPGVARGILDRLTGGMRGRANVAGGSVADLPTVQVRLAEAAARIDAASALLRRDCEEIDRMGRAGEVAPLERRAAYRRDWAFAVSLSVEAMETLRPLLGARGLDLSNPAQRLMRDLHAVSAHAALTWDIQAQHFGRATLGLPVTDPRI